MKFKIGDKVKADQGYSFDPSTGTVIRVDDNYCMVQVDKGNSPWSYPFENLELLKPMGKVNYILVYDTQQGDPVEYFETLKDTEKRIEELTRQNGAILDSVKVYEVKSVGVVKGIKIDIKFEK